jgi:hypothetical protein
MNPQPTNAFMLHTPVLTGLPERLRRWLNATYASHGGAEHMTLEDWRGVEQELKRRLQNEPQQHLQ